MAVDDKVEVKLNQADVDRLLGKLLSVESDITKPLEQLGEAIIGNTQRRFEEEVDPDGKAWAPLSESTIKQRRKGNNGTGAPDQILNDTGLLKGSYIATVVGRTLEVGTNVEYAVYHQGVEDSVDGNLPVREHLGISDEDVLDAEDIISNFLEEKLG